MNYLVLFDRDAHDETIPPGSNEAQRFAQLERELLPSGLAPGYLGCIVVEGRDVFAASIPHDGDEGSLCAALQAAYDADGTEGWFQIVGTLHTAH